MAKFYKWNEPAPESIDDLSDVDTSTAAPTLGQVLGYDGTKWGPVDGATPVHTTINTAGGVVLIDGNVEGEFVTIKATGHITDIDLVNMVEPSRTELTILNGGASVINLALNPDLEVIFGGSPPSTLGVGESIWCSIVTVPTV